MSNHFNHPKQMLKDSKVTIIKRFIKFIINYYTIIFYVYCVTYL